MGIKQDKHQHTCAGKKSDVADVKLVQQERRDSHGDTNARLHHIARVQPHRLILRRTVRGDSMRVMVLRKRPVRLTLLVIF